MITIFRFNDSRKEEKTATEGRKGKFEIEDFRFDDSLEEKKARILALIFELPSFS